MLTSLAQTGITRVARHIRPQRWFRLLAMGALLWGCSIVALTLSGDGYIVPTAVVFGAFVVPIAWVVRTSDRHQVTDATPHLLMKAFVYGGTLGFLSSALLETPFLSIRPALFKLGVALIEEASKALALVWIARRLRVKSPAMGFVLGAAVGFGFEALEDAGYSLSTLAGPGPPAWSAMVNSELTRAVTAPVTHGLWTAILGAVLFHESRDGRFRLSAPAASAFVAVAALHYLWDLVPNISLGIDLRLFDLHSAAILPQSLPAGASGTVALFNDGIGDIGLILVGIAGVAAAHRVRQRFGIDRSARPFPRRNRASRAGCATPRSPIDETPAPATWSPPADGPSPLALTARYSLADRHRVAIGAFEPAPLRSGDTID